MNMGIANLRIREWILLVLTVRFSSIRLREKPILDSTNLSNGTYDFILIPSHCPLLTFYLQFLPRLESHFPSLFRFLLNYITIAAAMQFRGAKKRRM